MSEVHVPESLMAIEKAEQYLGEAAVADGTAREDLLDIARCWIEAAGQAIKSYIKDTGNPFEVSHLNDPQNDAISRYRELGGEGFPPSDSVTAILVPARDLSPC